MTLQINASDAMSSRMHETVISLLSECRDENEYLGQPHASIIKRLIYNYISFAETGSDRVIINRRVNEILNFAKKPGSKGTVLESLSILAEAAPVETISFVENEIDQGLVFQKSTETVYWSSGYHNIIWALYTIIVRHSHT